MTGEFPSTPERKKPEDFEFADLQAISAAFVGLLEDDEIETKFDERSNATKFAILDWLKKRTDNERLIERLVGLDLSVSQFYLDPGYIERIKGLDNMDDFPVIHEELFFEDEETKRERYRGNWQRSFFDLQIRFRGFNPIRAQLFVNARNSGFVHTNRGNANMYLSSYDEKGPFSVPYPVEEAEEVTEMLINYGKELQEA